MNKKYIIIYVHLDEYKTLIQQSVGHDKKWKFDSIQEAEDVIKDIQSKKPKWIPTTFFSGATTLLQLSPNHWGDLSEGVFYIQESYCI